MTTRTRLGPRAFLKASGFLTDAKPARMDAALLKALDPGNRQRIEGIWANRNLALSDGLEMYEVPQTVEQAALLFSHDWPRAAATMDWFDGVVRDARARSVAEMGCGAGFLLAYLKSGDPGLAVRGIDAAANLGAIAARLTGGEIAVGDYTFHAPAAQSDLVICDFGFDLASFAPSVRPHDVSTVGGELFCRNCSDDLAEQLRGLFLAWRAWGTAEASLALSGRLGNFGSLRAVLIAARTSGWEMRLERSRILKVRTVLGEQERFPAILFVPAASARAVTEEELAIFFGS